MYAFSRYPVQHLVFSVGGVQFDELKPAMAFARENGVPYRDEEGDPNVQQSWEDKPSSVATRTRGIKKAATPAQKSRGRKKK